MTVGSLVHRAARSCEYVILESTGTLERLVGALLPSPAVNRPLDDPWWSVPENDERFVSSGEWDRGPAGPWGTC